MNSVLTSIHHHIKHATSHIHAFGSNENLYRCQSSKTTSESQPNSNMGFKNVLSNITKNILHPIASIATAFSPLSIMIPCGVALIAVGAYLNKAGGFEETLEGRALRQFGNTTDSLFKKAGIHSQPAEKCIDNFMTALNSTPEIMTKGFTTMTSNIGSMGIKNSLKQWYRDCTLKNKDGNKTKLSQSTASIWNRNKEKLKLNKNTTKASLVRKFSNDIYLFDLFNHQHPEFLKNYIDIMGKNPDSPHHMIATSNPKIYAKDAMKSVRQLRQGQHQNNIQLFRTGFTPKQNINENLDEKKNLLKDALCFLRNSQLSSEHQKTQMCHTNNHIIETTINNITDFYEIISHQDFNKDDLSLTEHYFKDTLNQFNALLKTRLEDPSADFKEKFQNHFDAQPTQYNQDQIFSFSASTMPHERPEDTRFVVSGYSHSLDKKSLTEKIYKNELPKDAKIHFKINKPEIDKETHQAILAYEIYRKNSRDIHNLLGIASDKITTKKRLFKNINLFFMPNNNLEADKENHRILKNSFANVATNMLTHLGACLGGLMAPASQTHSKLEQGFKNIIKQNFVNLSEEIDQGFHRFNGDTDKKDNETSIDENYVKKFHQYTNLNGEASSETIEKVAKWFKDSLAS